MELLLPHEIRHDQNGFKALVGLYEQARQVFFETIAINMEKTAWFDADMCAVFGALLYRLGENLNTIQLNNIKPEVRTILSKNGFLGYYGHDNISDKWQTTIAYKQFDVKAERYFANYIDQELIKRSEMPNMSDGLLKKLHESIFEIFSNAILHSGTRRGVFSCGQIYPKKKTLDFMVVDLGIGMCKKVGDYLGKGLAPEEAIQWATEKGNTTKSGGVPGGLGLKLLREFLTLNQGKIQIVSDAGYWCQRAKEEPFSVGLDVAYPGTIVHLEIRTNDVQSYALKSELEDQDIF